MKRLLAAVYAGLLLVMGAATIIEKYCGTAFVSTNIYGSWWFSLLWAAGVSAALFWFIKRRAYKRFFVLTLHLSFVVILFGALLTHLTARRGSVRLPEGRTVAEYTDTDGDIRPLGLTLRLDHFDVTYHTGTEAPKDYISTLTINSDRQVRISMNHIYRHGVMRFYQAGYSADCHSSTLVINSDPYGIPVTYTGYALLFISLVWMLFAKEGRYRQLVRHVLKPSLIVLLFANPLSMQAQQTLSPECAREFGGIYMVYNDRVCPMETYAIDFTKKLYGSSSYKDFSATQVLAGFMFWSDDWMKEPILRIKKGPLRSQFNLDGYISPATLFGMDGYLLGPYLQESHEDKFHQEIHDLDDILSLIMQVQQTTIMKAFPFTAEDGEVYWFSPTDSLPASVSHNQQRYIHDIIPLAATLARQGNEQAVKETFHKFRLYQHRYGGSSLPSMRQLKAEGIYNHVPFATILFMINLALSISCWLLGTCYIMRGKRVPRFVMRGAYTVLLLSFLALSFALILRWIISGTIPMGNGYETMLVIAWVIMLVALLTARYIHIMTLFGLLMSGFMLLVSHLGQMNPAITHRMPVLNSPLLGIHVSVIMMAYALLSLTFIISLSALVHKRSPRPLSYGHPTDAESDTVYSALSDTTSVELSLLLLYPAVTLLGIGIFVGAIWANVSWGTYWSWDAKEVWALITFMVYAIPLHPKSLPAMQKPTVYHGYMLLAFLTVIMTYFGVNYFLTGMHSYT